MKNRKGLKVFLLCLLVISIALAAGTAIAYMLKDTQRVQNDFVPASVACEVSEEFDGSKKSSITVQNTGNTDAYIRVRLVSYWVNESGEPVGKPSEALDISYDSALWQRADNDTYYYMKPVAPEDFTDELLTAPIILKTAEHGGETVYQAVDVFAEAIQAKGKTDAENGSIPAIEYAWGVSF